VAVEVKTTLRFDEIRVKEKNCNVTRECIVALLFQKDKEFG
jgi:hypothetical protein